MSDSHIKALINEKVKKRWNRGWVNCEGHRQTKVFFPELNPNKNRRADYRNKMKKAARGALPTTEYDEGQKERDGGER